MRAPAEVVKGALDRERGIPQASLLTCDGKLPVRDRPKTPNTSRGTMRTAAHHSKFEPPRF